MDSTSSEDEEQKLELLDLEGLTELLLEHHLTLLHHRERGAFSVLSVDQESLEECQNRTNEIGSGNESRCEDLPSMLEDGQEEGEWET